VPISEDAGAVLEHRLAHWPAVAAAGVVSATGAMSTAGHVEEAFEWASVTKLLVALASLVAVQEGTVSLDDPAGGPDAEQAGTTFAHLLAHASGLPLNGRRPLAPPGTRRIYSNTGIQLAAAHIGTSAGMPFAEYLKEGVLEPLGMRSTVLAGSPAYSARGPLSDLVLLGRELLSPTLVSPEILQRATTVAWPGLSGVLPGFGLQRPCDWGLGFEIRDHKSPHWTGNLNSPATFGHFGQSGSFLWVDPIARVALAALGAAPFGPWAASAWPSLSDAVLTGAKPPGLGAPACA
jgi:CubicO group peptidase (beta-lactamase class C family)